MMKITTDVVKERLERDIQLTVVDSRSAEAWDKAEKKAGGAIRIPPDEAEQHIADLDRHDYIVIYCT
jgi:rhodanese-related sulfurtransferase